MHQVYISSGKKTTECRVFFQKLQFLVRNYFPSKIVFHLLRQKYFEENNKVKRKPPGHLENLDKTYMQNIIMRSENFGKAKRNTSLKCKNHT